MSTIFNFKDSYTITRPTEEDLVVWKDSLGSSYIGPKKALRILVEATHAALVNRNARWYSPAKMRDGADTFVNKNKPAKILKHHDTHSDPVGVVRGSRFVSTVPADLLDNPDVAVLMSSTASMKDQIKAMKRLIKSGVTKREDWKGLGYIEVMADILDQEAIEQISDGRFDAVSTSFSSPGHAYCFICGKNWAQDGMCEHTMFGESYEDEDEEKWPMMLIPGLHVYDEMSLVVHDADPYTVIKVSDSKEDKVLYEYKPEQTDSCLSSGIRYEFKDFVNTNEEAKMAYTSKEINDKVIEEVNAFFAKEENKDIKDESKELLADCDKLPEASFCGPDRSFPAVCLVSAKACLAVLDTLELEGKDEIKENIMKKITAFSAGLDIEPAPKQDEVSDEPAPITDEELQASFAKIEAELIARNLKVARECSKCADSQNELEKANDEVKTLKASLEDARVSLAVLREELKFQQSDYVHQVDKFIDLSLEFKELKQEKLAIMGTLVGKYKSIDIAKESLKTEDMVQVEASIVDKFDLGKMVEKLNDGMSKTPKAEKIESPVDTGYSDNLLETLTGPAAGAVNTVKDMLGNKEVRKAKTLYSKMVSMGVIPKEITFETISATIIKAE